MGFHWGDIVFGEKGENTVQHIGDRKRGGINITIGGGFGMDEALALALMQPFGEIWATTPLDIGNIHIQIHQHLSGMFAPQIADARMFLGHEMSAIATFTQPTGKGGFASGAWPNDQHIIHRPSLSFCP